MSENLWQFSGSGLFYVNSLPSPSIVDVLFNLVFTTEESLLPSLVTSLTGSLTYNNQGSTTYQNTSGINLLTFGSVAGNDNILQSLSSGNFFTSNGIGILDNINDIRYRLYSSSNTNSFIPYGLNIVSSPINFFNPSLSAGCVLINTLILTPNGNIKIQDLKSGDFVLSQNNNLIEIEALMHNTVKNEGHFKPYIIPKGYNGAFEDLYLTGGHAYLEDGVYKKPMFQNFEVASLEDSTLEYYHLKLKGNNRRETPYYANGVLVESYSTENIE